jgi:hypothetical protein
VTTPDATPLDLTGCTAVLLSAPREVASRIESFLLANRVPCRIRLNTEMTPEKLLEEHMRQSPEAGRVLDMPLLGPLLRGRLAKDLKAEIHVIGSEIPPVWDILVRPEDLPEREHEAEDTSQQPRLNVLPGDDVEAPEPEPEPAPAGSPVAVTELPWDEAWALSDRLNAAGIPAAVMAAEEQDRDRPMSAREVPVGVRPQDLERARALLD